MNVVKMLLAWPIILVFFMQNANAFNVDISAKSDGSTLPRIIGKTNLPNETQLMISVERPENGYGGDAKTLVVNGEFDAGPFSVKGENFKPGEYRLTVIMLDPALQLQHVKDVIGANGKKLTGKLVKIYATGNKGAIYKANFKIEGIIDKASDKLMKEGYETEMQNNFCTSGCNLNSNGSLTKYNACMKACLK